MKTISLTLLVFVFVSCTEKKENTTDSNNENKSIKKTTVVDSINDEQNNSITSTTVYDEPIIEETEEAQEINLPDSIRLSMKEETYDCLIKKIYEVNGTTLIDVDFVTVEMNVSTYYDEDDEGEENTTESSEEEIINTNPKLRTFVLLDVDIDPSLREEIDLHINDGGRFYDDVIDYYNLSVKDGIVKKINSEEIQAAG